MAENFPVFESSPRMKVKAEYDALRILINDALHIHLVRSKLLGVQSWVREPEGKFVIEYTMVGGHGGKRLR